LTVDGQRLGHLTVDSSILGHLTVDGLLFGMKKNNAISSIICALKIRFLVFNDTSNYRNYITFVTAELGY